MAALGREFSAALLPHWSQEAAGVNSYSRPSRDRRSDVRKVTFLVRNRPTGQSERLLVGARAPGRRQLSCPSGDNYLGRLEAGMISL